MQHETFNIENNLDFGKSRRHFLPRDKSRGLRAAKTGEKDREHIFDRFYRADSSRARHSGGIGLGLIAARAFAEAHGGQIEVKSWPGDGAAFTLRFPNAPEDTVMQEPWPTAAGAGHAQLPRP